MARREELTDEQWSLIEPLFDKPPVVATRGRPRRAEREVLNGMLWILRSGARWFELPEDSVCVGSDGCWSSKLIRFSCGESSHTEMKLKAAFAGK